MSLGCLVRSPLRVAMTKSLTGSRFLSGMKGGLGGGFNDILDAKVKLGSQTKPTLVAYGDHAFQINDIHCEKCVEKIRQSVILLPNSFLLWNAKTVEDITIDNLTVFTTLYPTLEVLFIGCGEAMKPISPEITKYFRKKGIVVEASSTTNAASTFNMLSSEGRNVAAALLTLLPPESEEETNTTEL